MLCVSSIGEDKVKKILLGIVCMITLSLLGYGQEKEEPPLSIQTIVELKKIGKTEDQLLDMIAERGIAFPIPPDKKTKLREEKFSDEFIGLCYFFASQPKLLRKLIVQNRKQESTLQRLEKELQQVKQEKQALEKELQQEIQSLKNGLGTTNPAAKLHVYSPGAHSVLLIGGTGDNDEADLMLRRGSQSRGAYASFMDDLTLKWGIGMDYRYSDTLVINDFNEGGDGTIRFAVNQNGNIGIGTTSPATPLHIRSTRPSIRFEDTTDGEKDYEIVTNGSNFAIEEAGVAVRFMIDPSGNVGIGTSSPDEKLHVAGNVKAKAFIIGDIFFQKDEISLWRMFEDENGLYLQNMKTGKVYTFVLQEVQR
jgi:hypothetical protein